MKNFELINELSKYPVGMEVKIFMIKNLDELPEFDEDESRVIDFIVKQVDGDGKYITLDGWTE